MHLLNKLRCRLTHAALQVTREEQGMLTLATIFAVLALIVMIGFMGNVGHAVQEKIELQNAADAAAYSSALWMARGMNTVTATNHLLGELTALCAVHEALGGPELDAYREEGWDSEQSDPIKSLNEEIRRFGDENMAPVTNDSPYWKSILAGLHKADTKLVEKTVERVAPKNEDYYSGATIYDAKLNLKRELISHLRVKFIANFGYFVPPMIGPVPAGYITAAAATAVHFYSSTQIGLIWKERMLLEAVELAAKGMSPIKMKIEEAGIPVLARFAEFVAVGRNGMNAPGGESVVAKQVQQVLRELGTQHGATLSVFPPAKTLQLPLTAEPDPQLAAASNWQDEDPPEVNPALLDNLNEMRSKANDGETRAMKKRTETLEELATLTERAQEDAEEKARLEKQLREETEEFEKKKKDDPNSKPEPPDPKLQKEIDALEKKLVQQEKRRGELVDDLVMKKTLPSGKDVELAEGDWQEMSPGQKNAALQVKGRAQIQWEADQLQTQLADLKEILDAKDVTYKDGDRKRLETTRNLLQKMLAERRSMLAMNSDDGTSEIKKAISAPGENPTIGNLRKIDVDTSSLRSSQWVRATYPYVDAFRSGIGSMFAEQLPISKAAASFRRYANHFSLVKPLQMRTGKGWSKSSAPQLNWGQVSGREALTMYVLKEMYRGNQPQKGREPWIDDERVAEQLFTIVGFAERPASDALFASTMFKNAHPHSRVAHAQAMLYNANEQAASAAEIGQVQANVGWDTLNWQPPVQAFEHEGGESRTNAVWPWELFTGEAVASERTRVKLNWQAKLVPVTATRISEARNDTEVPRPVRDVLDKTEKNFGELITH